MVSGLMGKYINITAAETHFTKIIRIRIRNRFAYLFTEFRVPIYATTKKPSSNWNNKDHAFFGDI